MQAVVEFVDGTINSPAAVLDRPIARRMREPARSFTKAAVAELSHLQISKMATPDLVAAVDTVAQPFMDTTRLKYLDRPTLLRLAHQARRCCRHQGY